MNNEATTRLALGTAQFGLDYGIANRSGKIDTAAAAAILSRAQAAGIKTLDTAVDYGDSETVLGHHNMTGWEIVSKVPGLPENETDIARWMHDQVAASLQRLGVPRLGGLLLHRPTQLLGTCGEALYDALASVKADGLTDRIGISIYDPEELDRLWSTHRGFDMVQAPLNIFDRRLITSGWLDRLHERGIEVHTRSAFLQGLLLLHAGERPKKFARWNNLWQLWDQWLAEHGEDALRACLGFPLHTDNISKVVVGVDSIGQLEEIVAAANSTEPVCLPDQLQCEDSQLLNPAQWEHS